MKYLLSLAVALFPILSFAQEAAEINRIMGKDLTAEQVERLKNSKLTRTFNDDDDLKIHY